MFTCILRRLLCLQSCSYVNHAGFLRPAMERIRVIWFEIHVLGPDRPLHGEFDYCTLFDVADLSRYESLLHWLTRTDNLGTAMLFDSCTHHKKLTSTYQGSTFLPIWECLKKSSSWDIIPFYFLFKHRLPRHVSGTTNSNSLLEEVIANSPLTNSIGTRPKRWYQLVTFMGISSTIRPASSKVPTLTRDIIVLSLNISGATSYSWMHSGSSFLPVSHPMSYVEWGGWHVL